MGWAGWETSEGREANFQDYPGFLRRQCCFFVAELQQFPSYGRHLPGSSLQGTERSRGKHPVPIHPQNASAIPAKLLQGKELIP